MKHPTQGINHSPIFQSVSWEETMKDRFGLEPATRICRKATSTRRPNNRTKVHRRCKNRIVVVVQKDPRNDSGRPDETSGVAAWDLLIGVLTGQAVLVAYNKDYDDMSDITASPIKKKKNSGFLNE